KAVKEDDEEPELQQGLEDVAKPDDIKEGPKNEDPAPTSISASPSSEEGSPTPVPSLGSGEESPKDEDESSLQMSSPMSSLQGGGEEGAGGGMTSMGGGEGGPGGGIRSMGGGEGGPSGGGMPSMGGGEGGPG